MTVRPGIGNDLKVEIESEHSSAVIKGKTSVPFKTFVLLVLQRKVLTLFTKWKEEPVILSSELLTDLAGAPQDSQENRAHLVVVTLGVGVLCGVFLSAIVLIILSTFQITLGRTEYFIIAGIIVGLALLSTMLSRMQRTNRSQKIADAMEKMANLLSK